MQKAIDEQSSLLFMNEMRQQKVAGRQNPKHFQSGELLRDNVYVPVTTALRKNDANRVFVSKNAFELRKQGGDRKV